MQQNECITLDQIFPLAYNILIIRSIYNLDHSFLLSGIMFGLKKNNNGWRTKSGDPMNVRKRLMRIAVIEDNELYNHLLTNGLKTHINSLPYREPVELEVRSFVDPTTALKEMHNCTDIVFLDYFLGEKITGIDVLRSIRKINPNCKVIIISQIKNVLTSVFPLMEGAVDFILKGPSAIAISCFTAADMIYRKLN